MDGIEFFLCTMVLKFQLRNVGSCGARSKRYQGGPASRGRAVASRMWCSLTSKFLVQKREAWLEAKTWPPPQPAYGLPG